MNGEVSVTIKRILPTPTGAGVFLTDGNKVIAIFIDHHVAAAITMFIHKVRKPRPLTHDLIGSILDGLGVRVEKVLINDLKEDTFFARIYMTQESEVGRSVLEVDARPSDSIALAVRHGCPILVSEKVWEDAQDMTWALEQVPPEEPGAGEAGEGEEPPKGG